MLYSDLTPIEGSLLPKLKVDVLADIYTKSPLTFHTAQQYWLSDDIARLSQAVDVGIDEMEPTDLLECAEEIEEMMLFIGGRPPVNTRLYGHLWAPRNLRLVGEEYDAEVVATLGNISDISLGFRHMDSENEGALLRYATIRAEDIILSALAGAGWLSPTEGTTIFEDEQARRQAIIPEDD